MKTRTYVYVSRVLNIQSFGIAHVYAIQSFGSAHVYTHVRNPELKSHGDCAMQNPATFTFEYTAPASFIGKTCKIAKNTTDFWSKTLYTRGRVRTYPTTTAWLTALVNGTQTRAFNFGDSFTAGILEKALSYVDVLGVDGPRPFLTSPGFEINVAALYCL